MSYWRDAGGGQPSILHVFVTDSAASTTFETFPFLYFARGH